MSGHSKWSQIKHKKALTDAKRGKIFSKMAREISIAVKTGGGNPDMNHRLRAAIDRARSVGLPKDNIERAVQKSVGSETSQELQEFVYEAIGPGGVYIIIEGITDNKNRALNEIKLLLSERGGKLTGQGSLLWNFEKIGMIEISEEANPDFIVEKIEEIIIESGASDFRKINNSWIIETNFADAEKVRRFLEKEGLKIKEVSHDFKPLAPVKVDLQTQKSLEELLDELDNQDDVQEIYTNADE